MPCAQRMRLPPRQRPISSAWRARTLCLGPGLAILPKTESTAGLSASTTPSSSDGAGGDFREPVHLVEIVGAWAENEFINAHIALALDRLFHRRARSRQRTEAPRRKIGIVSVVPVDIAAPRASGAWAARRKNP